MKFIFADTLYWIAVTNPNDQWCEKTLEVQKQLQAVLLITTEAVLIELLNYFASYGPQTRQIVAAVVRTILSDPSVEVVSQTYDVFMVGLKLYENPSRNASGP